MLASVLKRRALAPSLPYTSEGWTIQAGTGRLARSSSAARLDRW
jgi:hypothetical protein